MKPKYLVRPDDFHIFELDESNGCYHSWTRDDNPTRPKAYDHFTFDTLTENYGFFVIDDSELQVYEEKNKEYHRFWSWQMRSDGHGGCKGGTYEEFLKSIEMGIIVS